MARHDKDSINDIHTIKKEEPSKKEDSAKKEGSVLMESATSYHPDKEHIKRHDEQHRKDLELAAMLQAKWTKLSDAEHRAN
jgi:hypothetical protein